MESWTDADKLKEGQYKDSSNLEARISIYRYSRSTVNWYDRVWESLGILAGQSALEVGCGSGALWEHNRERIPAGASVVLTDISEGMLADAETRLDGTGFRYTIADAQNLPFVDGSFDRILANHMIYHIPDIPRALSEFRRVLVPGGRLVAATNGLSHLRELRDLLEGFDSRISFPATKHTCRFGLENGLALLQRHFRHVSTESFPSELVVPEVEAIVDYALSMDSVKLVLVGDRLAEFRQEVASRLARDGTMPITTLSCIFTAE